MVSAQNVHVYRISNVSWFILGLEKRNKWLVWTQKSNTVVWDWLHIIGFQGTKIGSTLASWGLLGNRRRSVITDHKVSIRISSWKAKTLTLPNIKLSVLNNLSYLQMVLHENTWNVKKYKSIHNMGKYYPGVPNIIIFVLVQFPPLKYTHTHASTCVRNTRRVKKQEKIHFWQVLQVVSFILIF